MIKYGLAIASQLENSFGYIIRYGSSNQNKQSVDIDSVRISECPIIPK